MVQAAAIEAALAGAGRPARVRSAAELSGGCIHRVWRVTLDDGANLVAKLNEAEHSDVLAGEADGLAALAGPGVLPVPRPIAVGVYHGKAVLLMTELPPARAGEEAWRDFGQRLARHHAADAGTRYGFHRDNHIGATPQSNQFIDDWVIFNVECRLGPQIELAARLDRLSREERRRIDNMMARLGDLVPRRPHPSLLHGDLWSGNALPTRAADGRTEIAVIDPACSVGDAYADIAMMKLFGGFPRACFDAYHEHAIARETGAAGEAVESGEAVERLRVYQLYHLLNHLNLFGLSYAAQVMAVISEAGF